MGHTRNIIKVPSVFMSSTFADFKKERSLIMDVVPYIDVHVICAERKGLEDRKLENSLKRWIDESDMVILLMGMRYGTESGAGYSWTEEEIRYAIDKKKRIFAYVRELDRELKMMMDRNEEKSEKLEKFVKIVNKYVPVIPRNSYKDYCRLIAMIVRDVDRYAEKLRANERERSYNDGFE